MTLDELKQNETAVIVDINDKELENTLSTMGFCKGESVLLYKIAPLNDPLLITSGLNYISIRKSDAKNIIIEKSN
jgi:Fe2+ transport system protein FeoA